MLDWLDGVTMRTKTKVSSQILRQVELNTGIKVITDRGINLVLNGAWAFAAWGSYIHRNEKPNWPEETICLTDICEDQLPILLHELAHATGSADRLNRPTLRLDIYMHDPVSRSYEELVAENTSLRLLKYFKVDTFDRVSRANSYCRLYSIPSYMYESMHNDVDKAFNYILTHWMKDLYFNPVEQEKTLMNKIKEFMKVA